MCDSGLQMALFMVVAITEATAASVETALAATFPNEYYKIAPHHWFVNASIPTAKDLSDVLGITNAGKATPAMGLVVSIKGYYGSAPGELWEWVAAKTANAANVNG